MLLDRLIEHTTPSGACIVWTGHVRRDGYAHTRVDGNI
jgi:hypothetical protein